MVDEEKQYKQSLSYDVNSPRQPQQPRTVQPKVPGEIEGVVTMTYGNEGSRMNMLYVKVSFNLKYPGRLRVLSQ